VRTPFPRRLRDHSTIIEAIAGTLAENDIRDDEMTSVTTKVNCVTLPQV